MENVSELWLKMESALYLWFNLLWLLSEDL